MPEIINNNNLPSHDIIFSKDEQGNTIGIDGVIQYSRIASNIGKEKALYLLLDRGKKSIFVGTSVNNKFECDKKITCEFYGWKGDDEYEVNKDSKDFTIKDFKDKRNIGSKIEEDADKLYLNQSIFHKSSISYSMKGGIPHISFYDAEIALGGRDFEEVKGWVEVAKGTGKYKYYSEKDLKEEQRKNPIRECNYFCVNG